MVSKYCVTKTMSITSLDVVPGTLAEKPNTLFLRLSIIAWCYRVIPKPGRCLASASPSAHLIWRIFSASAFSLVTTLILATQ
ncbi:hypothetical protein GIB67_021961 [Kingdonia uniflora]|uniref:Uncharacterized protein n=1 Tax=Kingdonia uniflora TaxID=39325 RepID=A0A7J7P7P6_9MAGN|nr:hypothetical protein GIB67_021961 [Kingdonia uniflora]